MKGLGVALAACCAVVFWPSAAHADPIGARAGATIAFTLTPGSEAFDGDADADDGLFTAQAGLDHSAHFAATGTLDLFNDDRVSLGNLVDVAGLATLSNNHVTLALRTGDNDGDHDGDDQGSVGHAAPPMPHAPTAHGPAMDPPAPHGPAGDPPAGGGVQTSATPEPASMLLLATGLAAVFCFRRQLFA